MSLRAMLWALYDAPTDDLPAGAFRVLLVLADHAGDDACAAYPAAATIAARLRISRRTVLRHISALRDAGLLRMGDQHLVDHVRGDRRPTVWDLATDVRGDRAVTPSEAHEVTVGDTSHGVTPTVMPSRHGVTEKASRGDSPGTHGVTPAVTQNRPLTREPKARARARVALCWRCGFEHDATQEACRPRSAMPANVAALIRRAPPKAVPQ